MPERTASLLLDWLAHHSPLIYVAVVTASISVMRLRRNGGSWASSLIEGGTMLSLTLLTYPAMIHVAGGPEYAAAAYGLLGLYGPRAVATAARPVLSIIAAIAQGAGKK